MGIGLHKPHRETDCRQRALYPTSRNVRQNIYNSLERVALLPTSDKRRIPVQAS